MASYEVTGTLVPDATGIYVENGTKNGQPTYNRVGSSWHIWSNGSGGWFIDDTFGVPPITGFWILPLGGPVGDYMPFMFGTGTATVSEYTPPPAAVAITALIPAIFHANGDIEMQPPPTSIIIKRVTE